MLAFLITCVTTPNGMLTTKYIIHHQKLAISLTKCPWANFKVGVCFRVMVPR
jgi:hypothetical protein